MATAQMSRFLVRLTRGMAAEGLCELTDRQLLERLLAAQDESVFEALVRRHGPMVYRVCWRVLQHREDAEDAFQAAFLVLARKVRAIRKRDSLASWLHGVAHRVALAARGQSNRRGRHEQIPNSQPSPPEEITWRELRTVLDSELGRLPEKWRQPLILCYLEGRSQEEAASQLGWSKSTLLRRLEEARQALGRRLTRRGVAWPAALSAILVSDCVTSAALPVGLVGSTVEAAACVTAGRALAAMVSTNVTALTEGVVKAMFIGKLKPVVAALFLGGAMISGAWSLDAEYLGAQPPRTNPDAAPAVAQLTPTAAQGAVQVPDQVQPVAQAPQADPKPLPRPAQNAPANLQKNPPLELARPGVPPRVVREDAQVQKVAWTADGKSVATISQSFELVEITDSDGKNPTKVLAPHSTVKLWDATTGKLLKSLGEERNTHINAIAFSSDQKHVAIMGDEIATKAGEANRGQYLRILDANTWAVKQELGDKDLRGMAVLAFAPDGKTLALGGVSHLAEKGAVVKLWDLERKKMTTATKLSAPPEPTATPGREKPPEWMVVSLAFSPDGKVLAAGEIPVRRFDLETGKIIEDSNRAKIQLYDGESWKPKQEWDIGESKGSVQLAFTADGQSLVSASGPVKLWDVTTGKERRALEFVKGVEYFQVATSPDGRHLATAGYRIEEGKAKDVMVLLWDLQKDGDARCTRTVLWKNPSIRTSSIAFSRDGMTLAMGGLTIADVKIEGSEKVQGELQVVPLTIEPIVP
jgi:RNA polymerase sigma factor (sigma-70 family)